MIEKLNLQKGNRARTIFVICNYLLMLCLICIMLIPLLKVLSDSFDGKGIYGLQFIPSQFSTNAYKVIITNNSLSRPFMVSVFVTVVGALLAMTLTTMGAYVLTQHKMPGRSFFVYMILFAMVFSAGLIPTYMVMKFLFQFVNKIWVVILLSALSPFNLILMKNFFQEIPGSLIEAAEIDGCSPFGIFLKIVLPMSKPALATIGLFCIVEYWNQYMHFVIYITDPAWFNFQVRLREIVLSDDFANSSDIVFGRSLQSAAIVVAILPVLILYPFLQKYFVKGINLGAIKG